MGERHGPPGGIEHPQQAILRLQGYPQGGNMKMAITCLALSIAVRTVTRMGYTRLGIVIPWQEGST